ncbi:DUF413 domain-containing protein, partial [Desulfobacterales bacterium HSG2]|nr:DUF413 domain-containing protein [Desulfobacterales bacterium HSG2]
IRLFREIFSGRQDIVPKYWTSRKTGKSGYSPLCKNEWRPVCQKGTRIRGACSICKKKEHIPLSDSLVYDHFTGKHVLGVYPLLTDNTCHFVAADFDNHTGNRNPLDDAAAFYEICQVQDIPCYVLRSKSGKGCHAFIFFKKAVPAWKARAVGFALLQEADVIGDDTEISSFDRLFPNQDRLSGKGFGNLIALPFQGKASKANHTLLLDPYSKFTTAHVDQWKALAEVEKISESVLDDLAGEWNLTQSDEPERERNPNQSDEPERERNPTRASGVSETYRYQASEVSETPNFSAMYPSADFDQIAERCAFIAHCRDDAETLPEPDWYILLTISARCENGERLSHRLSEAYPEYSQAETSAKIYQAMNNTGPYCCRTIKRISGKYCKSCKHYGKVKSPIILGWTNGMRQERPVDVPGVRYGLTEKEESLIRRYYAFYRSLDEGTRKPQTAEQRQFEAVCRGYRNARTVHERAYLKYKAGTSVAP